MHFRHAGVLTAVVLLAAACTVGPNYKKPPVTVPAEFKEAAPPDVTAAAASQLEPAQPQDMASRGQWWTVFNDPQLNSLEDQVAASNQTIAQAAARFAAARAAVLGARSGLYPTVTAGASATRSQGSASRVITGAASASGSSVGTTGNSSSTSRQAAITVTGYQLPIDFTYELDLWGRVRRGVEASVAGAQASAADLATATLSMQSELALDYFQLRGVDAQKQLLDSSVAAYERALQLTIARHNQGVASGVDVAQAQTQLETTRAQSTDLGVARAQFEHAIAVLIGKPPAMFSLAGAPQQAGLVPPVVPAVLPADLLQRRPDIAAAERTVAAANAQIGVAKAAYFPTLGITASGGLASSTLSTLLSWPSRFWSLGPSLVETVFDGGRRRSATEQATANWQETVAAYRQSVLSAFQDVEDNLAALRILAQEATEQTAAVDAARRALDLANSRYQGGITTYLEVITAQTAALANERTGIELLTRRMVADVLLVKALGGGWNVADLPAPRAVVAASAR